MAKLYFFGSGGLSILVVTDSDPVAIVKERGTGSSFDAWGWEKNPMWDHTYDVGEQDELVEIIEGHCC